LYNERGQSLKLGSNIKMYVSVPIITSRKNAASLKFRSTYEIIRVPRDLQFHGTAVCLGAKIKGKLSVCRINRAGKIEDFNHRSEGKDFGKGAQTLTQCNFFWE